MNSFQKVPRAVFFNLLMLGTLLLCQCTIQRESSSYITIHNQRADKVRLWVFHPIKTDKSSKTFSGAIHSTVRFLEVSIAPGTEVNHDIIKFRQSGNFLKSVSSHDIPTGIHFYTGNRKPDNEERIAYQFPKSYQEWATKPYDGTFFRPLFPKYAGTLTLHEGGHATLDYPEGRIHLEADS